MGYTHYWTRPRFEISKAVWKQITNDVQRIVALSPTPLAYESDQQKPPCADGKLIRFNGIGEDGHETFYIERSITDRKPRYQGDNPKWTFCKTAHKPYDVAVTAVLAYLDSRWPDLFKQVSSDGEPSDWQAGIELARKALPELATTIRVPRGVTPYTEAVAHEKIITVNEYPPIPDRSCDWLAHYEGEEEKGDYGWGRTEQEAINDLKENYEEPK
jgi:hypothetical protein